METLVIISIIVLVLLGLTWLVWTVSTHFGWLFNDVEHRVLDLQARYARALEHGDIAAADQLEAELRDTVGLDQ